MSGIIGFENHGGEEHRLSNPLDGKLILSVWFDAAAGATSVWVNGTQRCPSDAGAGASPYYCGKIELPRGEFTVRAVSGCPVKKILLSETVSGELTAQRFEMMFANRSGQWVFERPKPDYTPQDLQLLRRHGFLFDGPGDCTVGKMPSGVPLGGFGCGKLEICEDGLFTAFTGNNNQDSPIYRLPGSFLALGAGGKARILQKTDTGLPYEPTAKVEAALEFPFARLEYTDPELPVAASLEAFSPHIPYNAADSALPVVLFDVTLTNVTDSEQSAAFCFSWENLINVGGSMNVSNGGERLFPLCFHTWNGSFVWSDRRVSRAEQKAQAICFFASDDRGNPMSFGEHQLYCSDPSAEAVPDRPLTEKGEKAFIAHLLDPSSPLENSDPTEFRAGAWIVRRRLAPRASCALRFALAWYMPVLTDAAGHDWSVFYVNRFRSAGEIASYALENHDRLYAETRRLNDVINASSLSQKFKTRLLDDRFVAATCSWYDRRGDFSINEAPTGMGGCLGTLDQRTASQCYYTAFYPELDSHELDLFRLSQAADGMCAHELGFASINPAGRPISKWPDLAAAYIIQVYHCYQRTGDRKMLDLHWPHIKKAIEWTLTLDDMHTAIPYTCAGRGSTFDNQFWEGINSFITSMQIASYRIGAACAELEGDKTDAADWRSLAKKAEAFRMEKLWNGEKGYFNNAYNLKEDKLDDSCFIASLAGDWELERAGIRSHLGHPVMSAAASAITAQCIGDAGLTDQGGRRDTTDGFTQYPLAYLAAAGLYAGNVSAAQRVVDTTERVITQKGCSTHFDQALTYAYDGTRHGLPYYMTAPASWNILDAAVGLRVDAAAGSLSLSPAGEGEMHLPVFLPGAWFWLTRSADSLTLSLSPIRSVCERRFTKLSVNGQWEAEGLRGVPENGYTVFNTSFDPGKEELVFHAVR